MERERNKKRSIVKHRVEGSRHTEERRVREWEKTSQNERETERVRREGWWVGGL